MGFLAPTIAPTPPHPRVLGSFGATALAMGGSNQMIFIITVRGPGHHPGPGKRGSAAAHLRRAARLGRGAGVDRTGPHVAEPGRRHLRRLRRGVSSLQSGARLARRHLLLVGWIPTCGLTALLSAA